jgi:pyridoxine 5-phosphate synthase
MSCSPQMTAFALELRPDSICLVPENRREVTTEGGLDVVKNRDSVAVCVNAMNAAGIKTSLFIDPDAPQIELAAELRAPWVELHTGAFAGALNPFQRKAEFDRLRRGAERARRLGLVVNAGHGINYANIAEIRALPFLHELNIGHSILSRALFTGIDEAVREMKRLMNS